MKRSPFFCDIAATNPVLANVQGWEVANQFTTVEEEHVAVRERVGVFDWSTTGEFEVCGPDALALVQKLIVNDASRMKINQVLYTTILNDAGDVVSDITVYRMAEECYMLMTAWGSNAANARPEYDLLVEYGKGMNATVTDVSSGLALLAIQGPQAKALLGELTDADLDNLKYMYAVPASVVDARALISRSGYTGELGYEVLFPAEHSHDFWVALMAAGEKYGLALCGMTAAFGLRMEKGYIMRFDFVGRTPYEIGLGWTVKLDKPDFIGRDALIRRKEAGFTDRLMSLVIQDGYMPANGDAVYCDGKQVGAVTSAAFGYTIGKSLALGFIPIDLAKSGVEVQIQSSEGEMHPAVVERRPLYNPDASRIRQ